MRSILLAQIAAFVVALTASVQPPQPGPTARLGWMAGCWERRTGTRVVEEQWMAPRGGLLLGASRTMRGDTLAEYEQMRITERGARLLFVAMPSGQPPGQFESTEIGDSSVVFASPAHDFPQRVRYRRQGADSLVARIEGTLDGQSRSVDFLFRRVACS
jgi:hypothetical protein